MQLTFTDSRQANHGTLKSLRNAVRWALPLLAVAALSAAMAGAASDTLDRAAWSRSMVFTGDPAGAHLMPNVGQAGR
jgi:hypothetical protein